MDTSPRRPLLRRVAPTLALASLALLSTGCRSIAPGRLRDLGDCGTFAIGLGIGLDASLELGCVAQPAVGVANLPARTCVWTRMRGYGRLRHRHPTKGYPTCRNRCT